MSGRGPIPPKGYFLPSETLETRMESELNRARLMPTEAAPQVDVEAFVEKHLGARLDQHAELGSGVLGQTEFNVGAPPYVRIDRELTQSAFDDAETPRSAIGRWRATVAHEAAHIVFHTRLFAGANLSLFEPAPASVLHRCETRLVMFRGGGSDWVEIQANMGMAALLMPQTIFKKIVRASFESKLAWTPTLAQAEPLVSELAARFGVSKQAFRIRLETLRLVSDGRQSEL